MAETQIAEKHGQKRRGQKRRAVEQLGCALKVRHENLSGMGNASFGDDSAICDAILSHSRQINFGNASQVNRRSDGAVFFIENQGGSR